VTSFLDLPVAGFLDQAAARQPAPGGGSAAALTVALAAGLAAMAARFSAAQLPWAAETADQADRLRSRATALIDEDARAYQAVLGTRRGPGAGENARREALAHAAMVPLEIAELAGQTTALAARVASAGNPNLRGDAITAVLLAEAAARSAAGLAQINIAAGDLDASLAQRARHAVARVRALASDLDVTDEPASRHSADSG
jgi:formiminotetrahydrofolate cyclodeaminase